MSFWNSSTGEVSHFGDDLWTVLRLDVGEFIRGFLVGLNRDWLHAPTLFERVERQGRRATSFNYLVFSGDVAHRVSPLEGGSALNFGLGVSVR